MGQRLAQLAKSETRRMVLSRARQPRRAHPADADPPVAGQMLLVGLVIPGTSGRGVASTTGRC
jgi:hypothetical protein